MGSGATLGVTALYWALIICCTSLLSQTKASDDDLLVCNQSDSFTVQLTEGQNVDVYGIELLVKNPGNVTVYSYPGTHAVNIVFANTEIQFKGYMMSQPSIKKSQPLPERVSWKSKGDIIGIGDLLKIQQDKYVLRACRLHLSPESSASPNLPLAVEKEIRKSTQFCLKKRACRLFARINAADLKKTNSMDELGPSTVLPVSRLDEFTDEDKCDLNTTDVTQALNLNMNKLVDMAVESIVKSLKKDHQEKIMLSDINESFTTGAGIFKTTGKFEASGGSFEDLTTIKRNTNAVLTNKGHRYTATSGFGLSVANLQYKSYKFKYGFVRVSGHISADVDAIKLEGSVLVDYTKKPCRSSLIYLKVKDMGRPRIHVTGLGILNGLASKILSWITVKWQQDIMQIVEGSLKTIAERELQKNFDCEKYRM